MLISKEMVYENTHSVELLMEGSYCGYKFAIVSLGTHPAAYVENKNIFPSWKMLAKKRLILKALKDL